MKRNLTILTVLISGLSFGQGTTENQASSPQLAKSEKITREAPREEAVQISTSKPDGLNATTKVRSTPNVSSGQLSGAPKEKEIGMSREADRELCEALGLDHNTASFQEMKAAMIKLQSEDPEKFKQLYAEYQSKKSVQVRQISRETYNALPAERKAQIDSHPEQYQIVEL